MKAELLAAFDKGFWTACACVDAEDAWYRATALYRQAEEFVQLRAAFLTGYAWYWNAAQKELN